MFLFRRIEAYKKENRRAISLQRKIQVHQNADNLS